MAIHLGSVQRELSSHQNIIKKETSNLNHKVDQTAPTNIYRTYHPTAAEFPFFSSTHNKLSVIDHVRTQNKS